MTKYLVMTTAFYSNTASGDEKFDTLDEAELRFNAAIKESQWYRISLYKLIDNDPWNRQLIKRHTGEVA